jgi:hypothetical protein
MREDDGGLGRAPLNPWFTIVVHGLLNTYPGITQWQH